MTNRLNKLEERTRAAHTAAWHHFFQRFRDALAAVPAGMFEGPFQPLELDDFSDLEDALLAWQDWADAALPVLEKAEQGDLLAWPTDLPPVPGDPSPLLSRVIAQWRKHPSRSVAALAVLLALAVAVEGEGGVRDSED